MYENIEDPQLLLEITIQIFWTSYVQTRKYCRYEGVEHIQEIYEMYCHRYKIKMFGMWDCKSRWVMLCSRTDTALDDHDANVVGMVVFSDHLYSKS